MGRSMEEEGTGLDFPYLCVCIVGTISCGEAGCLGPKERTLFLSWVEGMGAGG